MHLLLTSSPNWYLSHVVAATHDGSIVAYAGHLSITVLYCQQQQILRCLWPQRIRVSCVSFAAAGSLLIAGYEDGSARCFDWQSGECICIRAAQKSKRKQTNSELTAVATPSWLPSAAVFADAGGRLLLWPFNSGSRNTKFSVLVENCGSKVVCLAAAPNRPQQLQQVVAGCQDGSAVLVDVAAGYQLAKWKAHAAAVHSLTWFDAADASQHSQQTSEQQQQQQQEQQEQQEQTAEQQAVTEEAGSSSSASGCESLHGSNHGLLVSVGADRRLKLWQVPTLGTPQAPLHPQDQPQQAAAAAAADAEVELPAEACNQPAASSPRIMPGVSSDAVASSQPVPVVLQLQPLSAAAVDPSPPGAGPKQQQFYGAAAVVPGSIQCDGSCVVLCSGVNGRLGAAALVPGDLACQWSVLNKTPHTGSIFQLLLQPVRAADQPGHLQTQQQQQQPPQQQQQEGEASTQQELQTPQHIQQLQEPVQDSSQQYELVAQTQHQRQQHLQDLIAGKYHVLSVSMDRCFVMSQLTIHAAAPAPAPPDSKGSTEKVALLSLPVTTSSSSYGTAAAQDSSGQHSCLALQLKGCISQWVSQGLGGFAYSCAVQHTYPDALEAGPKYSKLRVAVGCGDKTIRVATMGVRAAAAAAVLGAEAAGLDSVQEQQRQQLQQQKKERGQPEAGDSQLQGASAAVATAAAAAPATLTQPAHSSSTAVSSSAEQQPSSELQLPVPKPTLLWRNIQDRAQALAWHPTNPRLLAFGCHDGSLGVYDVSSSTVALYSKRHAGPVTHLAWQQQQQQQQQVQDMGKLTLLSTGGEGCLLSWPAITPGSNSSWAQPTDLGAQLQSLLPSSRGAGSTVSPCGQGHGIVHWSSLAVSACGSKLAACSTRGQVLLLGSTPSSTSASTTGGSSGASVGGGGSSSHSWRSSGTSAVGGWHLMAQCNAPSGLPIKAAVWQPQPGCVGQPAESAAVAGAGGDAAAAAAAAAAATAAAAAAAAAAGTADAGGAAGCGALLAAIDDQNLWVFSSSEARLTTAHAEQGCAAASCSVPSPQQQQKLLLAVAWVTEDTICVGCSDGSIQVVKVLRHITPGSTAAAAAVAAAAAASDSPPLQPPVTLLPLHSLRGHTGPVLCVSGLPGWPGLLLSGSQDQTLRSWQPLLEPNPAPASLQSAAAAAAAATAAASTEAAEVEADGGKGRSGQAAPGVPVVMQEGSAGGSAAVLQWTDAVGAAARLDALQPQTAADAAQQPQLHATGQQLHKPTDAITAQSAAADVVQAASQKAVLKPAKRKPAKTFICPKAKTFLPDVPDTSNPLVHQQVLLDVVALAEALYPPAGTTQNPGVHVMSQGLAGLDREVLETLGIPAGPSGAAATGGQQQQQQQSELQEPGAHTESSATGGLPSGHAQDGVGGARVAWSFQQQLAGLVDAHYPLGSWLPTMTADVPELLLQHQAWQQQQQGPQQQHQQKSSQGRQERITTRRAAAIAVRGECSRRSSTSSLNDSQVGMLKFLAGDVGGFLRAAVAADKVSPEVVALAAASGQPAFSTVAKLAASQLAAAGDAEAAAVHLLAAGAETATADAAARLQ